MNEFLQSNLGSNIAGGLVVAAIVGIVGIVPKLRRPTLAAIGKSWRWIRSIRVITSTRMNAEIERRSQEQVDEALGAFFDGEPADDSTWDDALPPAVTAVEPPLQKPRWLIAPFMDRGGARKSYYIQNLKPDAEARDVRVEDPSSRTVFHDAAAWADVPTDGVGRQFVASFGYAPGFLQQVEVHWTDARGHQQIELVQLDMNTDDDYLPF
ncbi:hypothetical protein [Curtobacterium sp. BH-2-1-1]|uniref:hypothetical protein n=1 Tax=Curtobacterium sp. BH-2-1-1 TaxID=1905847 RepID=UPI0011A14E2A|nr:hypothetical protein [Curtobacterium sp. BH-2-1-1]